MCNETIIKYPVFTGLAGYITDHCICTYVCLLFGSINLERRVIETSSLVEKFPPPLRVFIWRVCIWQRDFLKDQMSQKPNEISDQQTRLVIHKHLATEQRDIRRGGLYTMCWKKRLILTLWNPVMNCRRSWVELVMLIPASSVDRFWL